MTRDPREEAERLVAAGLAAVSRAARGTTGFATGSAECCVCPLCKAIAAARDPDPGLAERLASGVGDLATGLAGVLRAVGGVTAKGVTAAGVTARGVTAKGGVGNDEASAPPAVVSGSPSPWSAATRRSVPPVAAGGPVPPAAVTGSPVPPVAAGSPAPPAAVTGGLTSGDASPWSVATRGSALVEAATASPVPVRAATEDPGTVSDAGGSDRTGFGNVASSGASTGTRRQAGPPDDVWHAATASPVRPMAKKAVKRVDPDA